MATASYSNVTNKISNNKVNIQFDLLREGNKSSYHDIKVSWKNPDGKVIFLKKIKNMAIYYPQTDRKVSIESDASLINKAGEPVIELSEVIF